ncbi:unnamed protein product [Linum trigynum]|uniref:CCHC-type domain-containing protein n=1 Tax=Linum trigynum TaxID=586398 RepID=A0AAV2G177_9ROSI
MSVKLNSKNYSLWEFQFRVFVEGKGLLGVLDGTTPCPIAPASEEQINQWKVNDARVRTWLLGSVDPNICLGLRLHATAHAMWQKLVATYSKVNASRQFDIQFDLARLEQGDRDVTAYLTHAQELWTEEDLLTLSLRPAAVSAAVIEDRERARLLHFLMRLRPEFERIRSSIIHRGELKMDGILGELIREETRLRTQARLDLRPGEGDSVLAAAAVPNASAYAVGRPQFQRRVPVSELQCHHCQEKGHLQKHCRRRNICVYCKKNNHIILDCRLFQKHHGKAPDSAPPPRPAYAIPQAEVVGSSVSAASIEQLVNAALQKALPTAISSAFATVQRTGFEDGEADRKGE